MTYSDLARIADSAYADAQARSGSWIACHSGCDSCCKRPFAITFQDAEQLRAGLLLAPVTEQEKIRERSNAAMTAFAHDFPGNLTTGELTNRDEWKSWFFSRHSGSACPVLDPDSGSCSLYNHRPIACRLYGPLIQIGGQTSEPCPLCFEGASREEVDATLVLVQLPEAPASMRETVIAWALAR